MNQNDYVILFDENGSPYIAHSGWLDNARNVARNAANAVSNTAQQVANRAKGVGRGVRKNHKYILKINENGKTRYFYKQEEVKAYYEAKRKGIKNPAEYAQKAADAASNAVDAVKNAASSTYNKAKDAANNTVSNAKNAYDRMKGEFGDRAEQAGNAVKSKAQNVVDSAKEVSGINARNRQQTTQKALDDANTALSRAENRWWTDAKEAMAHPSDKTEAREKRSDQAWSDKLREREQADAQARDARIAYSKTPLAKAEKQIKNMIDTAKDIAGYDERERRDAAKQVTDTKRAEGRTPTVTENTRTAQTQKAYNKTPLGMIENAKNAVSSVKDTTEKATNSVKDMIDQAKKSKKNRDGSAEQGYKDVIDFVNIAGQYRREAEARGRGEITNTIAGHTQSYSVLPPRDSQWRKDQEHADELATKINRTVNDYINGNLSLDDAKQKVENYKAELDSIDFEQYNDRKVRTPSKADATGRARARQFGSDTVSVPNARATKSSYGEYSDNDKDFAEKNYSKKNHVEDTDFYTFKRDDGKWVILEEDMKWVLPEGVTGNDPGVRNALKQFADHASAAKAIGNENYNTDQWVDAVTEAIDSAAEKQKKKK